MLVLGLESSCDETAAALVEGDLVISEVVRSQVDLHRQYGGVVPEIASRAHLEAVDLIVTETLKRAQKKLTDLEGIAVTQGPGLVGALLVALSFAKGLALALELPLTGVNHVKAHALAPFLREMSNGILAPPVQVNFPLVALVASGGHTSLFLMEDRFSFITLGRTLDDAAGEAFDKSAKLMGLGYPGGKVIEELAATGNPEAFLIRRPLINEGLDFSFSGLKTRIMTLYQEHQLDNVSAQAQELKDLAASFQAAAVDVLVTKLIRALKKTHAKGAVLSGGVAANGALRNKAREALQKLSLPLFVPKPSWCADNAAMIGYLGGLQLERGENLLAMDSEAVSRWPVDLK
ncbi:MAG: tRNA (adenosine(37)-N6)-threonylcarbamoyltransferase complex transferase subunit TsaD [Deltaproteobacteria bacterium]|jgi:N6-L-threonylcarbamoyladenine synthase|nr:tRNA (adenosine(37)-N6)-threonylcarbamoyltransferase complex transferase subunit TsaD [Deltaproteobacteria bacterium]